MKKSLDFSILKRMMSELGSLKYIMIVTILCGLGGYFAAAAIPIFTVSGGLEIMGIGFGFNLRTIFLIIAISAAFRGLLRYSEQLSGHYIAFKILASLRDKVFVQLRLLAPAKLDGVSKGDIISVITADIELLETFYAHTIAPVAIAFLASAVYATVLFKMHWLFGLVGVMAYIIAGVIMPLTIKKMSDGSGTRYRAELGKSGAFFLDSLRGIAEIALFGAQKRRGAEIDGASSRMAESEKELKRNEGLAHAVGGLIVTLSFFTIFFIGAALVKNGNASASQAIIAAVILVSSFGPVLALSALSTTLASMLASARRVFDLLDEKPRVNEVGGLLDTEGGRAEYISADFSYPGRKKKIIQDFNKKIRENSITGFIGPSGSGKSTALKLMMRFYDVDEGRIEIAKCDIRQMPTQALRKKQTFMAQENMLFDDTLENNIRMGDEKKDIQEVYEAAKKASIHGFIESLAEGYQTRAGELGERLSMGEKQRIALARAFFIDSEMLLLDEPTSNLDALNEAQILKSLRDYCREKTVVLVSHRKSTSSICENIVEFSAEK